ncbi:sigma-70 family RNA polymerase sigma factor [Haliangium sp.]|uniref:sigma-70 family RNA polymerase sigma factor n=1 Tax=Haliangium sp. TaxID=2663208 RepID=UPI003D1003E3
MSEYSDSELIARAQGGDRAALDALLARIEPMVYRFGQKLCGHPEDAKGVLQETMITLVRSLDDFRGDSSLATWLYAIARSHCSKKRRKSKYAPAHVDSLDAGVAERLADAGPDPAQDLERRRLEAALDGAIRHLDDKYRDVLVLRDIEGLSAAEVATVTGLSVAAVKSRLHRARAALRRELAAILDREGAPEQPGLDRSGCPNIADLMSRKLEGELTADACAEVEAHVAVCARCQAECDALRRTLAVCASTPLPEVPAEVQAAVRAAARDALGSKA